MEANTRLARANMNAIVRAIQKHGSISRAELATDLGLTPSSVTDAVKRLAQLGFVEDMGAAEGPGHLGRPRRMLEISGQGAYFVGVQLDPDYYAGVVMDLSGAVVHRDIARDDADAPVVDRLESAVHALVESAGVPLAEVACVCSGLPGIMDTPTGVAKFAYAFGVESPTPIAAPLGERLRAPTILINDADGCAIGALRDDRIGPDETFLLLILNHLDKLGLPRTFRPTVAVGMSLVLNGKLWNGTSGAAGEFRSFQHVAGDTRQLHLRPEEERQLMTSGKHKEEMISDVTRNIAFLLNTLDIETFVLAGDMTHLADDLERRLREEIRNNWMFPFDRPLRFIVDPHHEYTVAEGAAIVAQYTSLGMGISTNDPVPSLVEWKTSRFAAVEQL